MGEGIGLGLLLIGLAGMGLAIMGGGPNAWTTITLLVIAGIWWWIRSRQEKQSDEEINDAYRKMFPGWTDEQIREHRRKTRQIEQQRFNKKR